VLVKAGLVEQPLGPIVVIRVQFWEISGTDLTRWRSRIPLYTAFRYQDVYPGIDLVYYGQRGQVEDDFIVAPGVDRTAGLLQQPATVKTLLLGEE
jgi:hypothetical protein